MGKKAIYSEVFHMKAIRALVFSQTEHKSPMRSHFTKGIFRSVFSRVLKLFTVTVKASGIISTF